MSEADKEMLDELSRLKEQDEQQRLRIFRDCLARNVCLASPLLLDATKAEELDRANWRLRPGPAWPLRGRVQSLVRGLSGGGRPPGPSEFVIVDEHTGETVQVMDQLVLRMTRRSAHMSLRIGQIVIRTEDDGGVLSVPHLLDPAESDAITGISVDAILRHPILIGKSYPIIRVRAARERPRSLIDFAAPPMEWFVPWNRPWDVPF
ncbi:hypothetical protein [Sphingobium sp.]|jgi:hypothetical protein|uniref:hypothetical protein n=1 Tax=Sphingobium sp. TaxID=1912891 RepID=UPI003BB79F5D